MIFMSDEEVKSARIRAMIDELLMDINSMENKFNKIKAWLNDIKKEC